MTTHIRESRIADEALVSYQPGVAVITNGVVR
jgi:hypothetical protein